MRTKLILGAVVALLLGLLGGPSALRSAEAAQPPLTFTALQFIYFGCLIGVLLVVGIPSIIARRSFVALIGPAAFALIAVYFAGSGLSALLAASRGGTASSPSAFLFLVISAGLLTALGPLTIFLRSRVSK